MAGRTATVFQAISKVCADVTGAKVVYGVDLGTSGASAVRPIGDDISSTPAIFLVPGPWSIIEGGSRRDTYEIRGAIYVPRESPNEGVIILCDLFDDLVEKVEEHAKAYTPNTALQSVVVTEGDGVTDVEWPDQSNAWYLTWPFRLEVKVNVSAFPRPQ